MERTTKRQLNYYADGRHPVDPVARRMAKEILYYQETIDAMINTGVEVRDALARAVCDFDAYLDAFNHIAHRK